MRDTILRGLDLLSEGLRPYILREATNGRCEERTLTAIKEGDVQFLLVFMWDYWNDFFRHELSFLDRSIISELREYRNRWAHQEKLTDHDSYRVADNVYRLLNAVKSDRLSEAEKLRCESLDRLWYSEIGETKDRSILQTAWPYLITFSSAAAICFVLLRYLVSPWNWILSVLVSLGLMRLAWYQSKRESIRGPGPRECPECSRIIYNRTCPYCHPESVAIKSIVDGDSGRFSPLAILPIIRTHDSGDHVEVTAR